MAPRRRRASRPGARRSPRAIRAPAAAVVETPLLFEAGMDGVYDATIAVVADEDVRAERAAARGHAAVDERAARQLTQDEKARARDVRRRNSGTVRGARARAVSGARQTACIVSTRQPPHPRRRSRAAAAQAAAPRRRAAPARRVLLGVAVLAALLAASSCPRLPDAVRELTLPLRHEDIIRQQAVGQGPRPVAHRGGDLRRVALPRPDVARGRARADADHARRPRATSPACPAARASSRATSPRRRSTSPTARTTCATCSRATTATRCSRSPPTTAGEGNVDRWVARAADGRALARRSSEIPFAETREYVGQVLDVRTDYRRKYRRRARALGGPEKQDVCRTSSPVRQPCGRHLA